MQLERIAPVTAVSGNCDLGEDFREMELPSLHVGPPCIPIDGLHEGEYEYD